MSPQVKRGELHQRRGGRQRRKCYQNPFVLVSECSVAGAARRELSAKLLHLVVGVHMIARRAGTSERANGGPAACPCALTARRRMMPIERCAMRKRCIYGVVGTRLRPVFHAEPLQPGRSLWVHLFGA
jgi:hypothetical protein